MMHAIHGGHFTLCLGVAAFSRGLGRRERKERVGGQMRYHYLPASKRFDLTRLHPRRQHVAKSWRHEDSDEDEEEEDDATSSGYLELLWGIGNASTHFLGTFSRLWLS